MALGWERFAHSKSKKVTSLCVVLCVLIILLHILFPPISPWRVYGQSVRITGRIHGEVEERITDTRTIIDRITIAGVPHKGRMLVYLPLSIVAAHGDTLAFTCKVKKPEAFDGFAYDRYALNQRTYGICYNAKFLSVYPSTQLSIERFALSIKARLTDRIRILLPEPHAAFVSGLLFGGGSGLSSEWKKQFSATGTSHILAASGYNVAILTTTFFAYIIQTRLGKRKGAYLTGALLIIYTLMAGATPSVMRAALMSSLFIIAGLVGRRASGVRLLLLVVTILLVFDPRLVANVGFQLSATATAAILWFSPKWERAFLWIPHTFGIRQSFVSSLCAIVFTVPIIWWHFGSVSLISPVANLLILPWIPVLMAFMGISLFVSFFSTIAGMVLALPVYAISSTILFIIWSFSAFV